MHTRRFDDQDGAQNGIVASLRLIDAEVAIEAELETRARFDQLTGLVNRQEVLERVAAVISHPRRTGVEAAILFRDIDGFKHINDEYGHADAARIAEKIRRTVARPIHADPATVTPTLSIGVTLSVPGETVDDAISRADKVMCEAKHAGGDRVIRT